MRGFLRILLLAGALPAFLTPQLTSQSADPGRIAQQAYAQMSLGDLEGAEKLFTQLSRMNGEYGLAGVDGLYDILERRGKAYDGMDLYRKHYQRTGNLEALARGIVRSAENGYNDIAKRELDPLFDRMRKGERLPPAVTANMAFASRRIGDLERAVEAGKRSEEDFRSLRNLSWITMGDMVAQTFEDLGRTLEAYNEYEFILQHEPDNPLILNNFAYHLAVHNKDLERSLRMVNRSLALDPGNGHSLDTKGFILIKLGRTEEAIDAMVASWRRVPDEMVVRTHLAQALARRKSKSETMQNLLDVLRTEPNEENTAEIDRLLSAIGE